MTEAGQIIAQEPILFTRDGHVFTNSRTIATTFRKIHRDVMRAIQNLLEKKPELMRNFAHSTYLDHSNGRTYGCYDIDRDGFALLVMGFTGAAALDWKMRYIAAFNEMEDRLKKASDPVALLNDPAFLRTKLLEYDGQILALKAEVEQKDAAIVAAAPKVEFHDIVARSGREMMLTDVGRHIGMGPLIAIDWMADQGLLFKRYPKDIWRPYSKYAERGWFKIRIVTVGEKERSQTMVTTLGLIGICRLAGKAVSRVDLFNAAQSTSLALSH